MRKVVNIFCLSVVFVGLIFISNGQDFESDIQRDLQRAMNLFKKQNYTEAAEIFDKCLTITKNVLNDNDTLYYNKIVIKLGECYYYSGQYKKAEPYFKEDLRIIKNVLGENNPYYITSLNRLISLNWFLGNYAEAELLLLNALKIGKNVFGEKHPEYALILNDLASFYQIMGNYEKAITLFQKAISIFEVSLGEKAADYAASIEGLALVYKITGNFKKAEPLFLQALKIRKDEFGENHPDYASSLNNLGSMYESMGNYAAAEPLFKQALKIRKEILGENHPNYATSLMSLAGLYSSVGNYDKAELFSLEALRITKNDLGEDHPNYAKVLNNLAVLYQSMGKYNEEEMLCLQAMKIRERVFGKNHPDYALSLNNLAMLYISMGNYAAAEPLIKQASKIYKDVLGENHPDYALSLDNLASLYISKRDYLAAEPLFLQALKLKKDVLGENHPDYALSMNNLATLYNLMGNYTAAETLYLKVIKFAKDVLGVNHPDYATSLENLALLYNFMGNYEAAEPLYHQALKINKFALGEEHPDYASSLNGLAFFYWSIKNYSKAEPLLLQANQKLLVHLQSIYRFLSEKELEHFQNRSSYVFNMYNSFSFERKKENPGIASMNYINALALRGASLQSSRNMRQAIHESGDSALISTFNQWTMLKEQLNFINNQPIQKRYVDTDSLENITNSLEKELVRRSQIFGNLQASLSTNWKDIQRNLSKNEATVEFINFLYYNGKEWTDSTLYCALVLKKGMEYPVMVPLCEQKQLDSLDVGGNVSPYLLYSSRGTTSTYYNRIPNFKKLYQLIWHPLEKELQDVKTVYYSPSGSLHQISFAALSSDTSNYLYDRFNLVQLSSTRLLATSTWQTKPGRVSSTALFGGIKYDLEDEEIAELQRSLPKNEANAPRGFTPDSTRSSTTYGFLDGTLDEVEAISTTLHASQIKTSLYTGIQGTEETFKSLSNRNTSVLHIATHGYFYPDVLQKPDRLDGLMSLGEQRFRYAPNPLLRSGLILAGGNRTWKGEEPVPGMEDGILTAQEISEMNLRNTELVVLSACETGLGDIKGGEGVFGLQRAFKLAGVKSIIMSLWKVDDKATSEMMRLFYSKWLGGTEKREAFRLAQQELKKKYTDPYYWAGFVMVD